jgi:hypothetical protein
MNKKLTYQESEEKRKDVDSIINKIGIITLIIIFVISFGYVITQRNNLQLENQQLKSQLNDTENEIQEVPEVDYHSSGELFCEHYNGTFLDTGLTWTGNNRLWCYYLKEDVKHYCKLNYINNKFVWEEPCEAIK